MENTTKSPKENISDKFRKERDNYSLEIRRNIEKLSNIKDFKEVQVFFLSIRQRLLEDNHTLIDTLSKLKKSYRQKRGKEWESVSNQNMRYQGHEKKVIVDGKTTDMQETVEIIENQISFMDGSIKTVDNVLFGLKTRLDLEKLLG
tara:strand:- start:32578 stop:33015 length:438 start_codon:yes stop_codon:yes gene_type:complete